MTLRMMFRPLIEFKVTIMRDDFPKYALRKALIVTRTSTILDSVAQVNIGRRTQSYGDSCKFPYLLTPALYMLVNAIPAMQQLHTIRLSSIFISRMYLYTILSSPYLIHLILDSVQLPKISIFPHPTLRKLTLRAMRCPWESVQPLIAQLAASLEYLELDWCKFLPPYQLQLPSFPCLQELRHRQYHIQSMFPEKNQLNELLRLGSQVTHLHVTGHVRNEPVTACRKSLQYLSTSVWMLSDHIFGTEPFPRLVQLDLRVFLSAEKMKYILAPSPFIHDHFPAITSFHLSIPWEFRNRAIMMARSQPNVQTLKLVTIIWERIYDKDSGATDCLFLVEVLNDQLHHAKLPAALQTLTLEAVQHCGELERGATRCIKWVLDDVIHSVTGLGGTSLKSVSLLVSQPKSRSVERERVLSRQWVRAPNDVWQVLE